MHGRTLSVLIFALTIVAVGMTQPGCGRSETPASAVTPGESAPVAYIPDTKPVPETKWTDATVPKGTPIKLTLIDTLTSQTSRKGDAFRALVTDAILIGGTVTVPSGSNVLGVVSDVVSGETGFKGRGGMLALEFDRINTPTGASAPLRARLTALGSGGSSALFAGGAAPGIISAGADGREVVLPSNLPIVLVLEEPLRIKVKQ